LDGISRETELLREWPTGPDILHVIHLGLDGDRLSHVGIDTSVQIMLGDLELTAPIRTGRHGYLVAPDASIVIADYSDARGHDVLISATTWPG
jgi:hypothetical protein